MNKVGDILGLDFCAGNGKIGTTIRKGEKMMFFAMNNMKNTSADARNCAPASSCMAANQNKLHLDTARLAVSFFVIIMILSLVIVSFALASLLSLLLTELLLMVRMIWHAKKPQSNGRKEPCFAALPVG